MSKMHERRDWIYYRRDFRHERNDWWLSVGGQQSAVSGQQFNNLTV